MWCFSSLWDVLLSSKIANLTLEVLWTQQICLFYLSACLLIKDLMMGIDWSIFSVSLKVLHILCIFSIVPNTLPIISTIINLYLLCIPLYDNHQNKYIFFKQFKAANHSLKHKINSIKTTLKNKLFNREIVHFNYISVIKTP